TSQRTEIRIVLAQVSPLVGDVPGNTRKVIEILATARGRHQADLVLLPELMLTGYPPEDLLLRPSLDGRIDAALAEIALHTRDIATMLGYPRRRTGGVLNMAGFFQDGRSVAGDARQRGPTHL